MVQVGQSRSLALLRDVLRDAASQIETSREAFLKVML